MRSVVSGSAFYGVLVSLLLLGLPTQASAGPVGCEATEGAWLDGPGYVVEQYTDADEDLLVLGTGGRIRIIDSSNPADLVVLSTLDINEPVRFIDISPDGNVVAVADRDNQVRLVDISNRSSPQKRGSYNPEEGRQPYGMDIVGNRLYIAVAPAGVWVLDITNLNAPVKLGSYIEPGTDFVFDLEVRGDYAYVADDVQGMRVVDINPPPANPAIVASYAASTQASNVRIDGARAYVARRNLGIDILDLTNATAPSFVGTFNTAGVAYRAEPMTGNRLAIPDGFNGTVILNIATPGTPTVAGGHASEALALTVQGNHVFALPPSEQTSVLRSLNFTVSNSPVVADSIDLWGQSKDTRVAGNKVLVANGARGMVVLNAALPAQPVFGDSYSTTFGVDYVEWVNNVAVAGSFGQLDILNVNDPNNIVFVQTIGLPGLVLDLDREGSRLFASIGTGLRIYNMANPASPALLGTYTPVSDSVVRVAVEGNRAFTSDGDTIRVVNITNPALPAETDDFTFGSAVTDLEAAGGYLYVTTQLNGVRILNAFSNPGLVAEVANIPTGLATPNGVAVEGNRLYVALQELGGVRVYDITNPAIPQFVEDRFTPGEALRVDISGGLLAVAEGNNGARTMVCGNIVPPGVLFEDGFESP